MKNKIENSFNPFELVFSKNAESVEKLYSKLVVDFNKNTSFPFDELLVKVAFTFLCNGYINQVQKTEKSVDLTELSNCLEFDMNKAYYSNLLQTIYRDWESVTATHDVNNESIKIMIQLIDMYKMFWGEVLHKTYNLEQLSNLFYLHILNVDVTKVSSDNHFNAIYFFENM